MMPQNPLPIRFRRHLAVLLCSLVAAATLGCSSGANLTVKSTRDHQLYQPEFDAAYIAGGSRGDLDVVATSESKVRSADGGAQVEQILHVHVLWQPMKGTKADSPTATNAVLHWYILSDEDGKPRIMTYEGAAFASVDASGDRTKVLLRNASLKPAARTGGMTDPIGPSTLAGTITADRNRERVEQVLGKVELTLTAAAQHSAPQREASSRIEP